MYRFHGKLALLALVLLAACDDTTGLASNQVSMRDECDPASFNAGLGAGTCVRQGNMTLAQFNAELQPRQEVGAWRFVPPALTIGLGQSIEAINDGGEEHTFTEVEEFGGGVVPSLNEASGNPVEAPECAQLSGSEFVPSGARFVTEPATAVGTEKYQCCIHPWMRAVVTVNAQ
jgi:plastocyanin